MDQQATPMTTGVKAGITAAGAVLLAALAAVVALYFCQRRRHRNTPPPPSPPSRAAGHDDDPPAVHHAYIPSWRPPAAARAKPGLEAEAEAEQWPGSM